MQVATEIKDNLYLIENNDRKVYLVATAHISEESAELVEKTIKEVNPDTICLELCQGRFDSLINKKTWQETELFQIIKTGKTYVLLAQLALAAFQKKLAKKFNIRPGEEMYRAIHTAQSLNIPITLVDRDIRTTLKRAWRSESLTTFLKLLFSSAFVNSKTSSITKNEIEELINADSLSGLLSEIGDSLPGVKRTLIDERDLYMAKKIWDTPSKTLVAIVGAGHIPGIIKALGGNIDLTILETIPPQTLASKILHWIIPATIIGLILLGFSFSDSSMSLTMIKYWFYAHGILAALGAAMAKSHPLTILAAFIASPFTALNPAIAAGTIAATVEAYLHRPKVIDLETFKDDLTSWGAIYKNRVTRILLVFIMTNLGSALGTILGGLAAVRTFFSHI